MLFLNVAGDEEHEVKSLGAEKSEDGRWYVSDRKDYCKFSKWFPNKGKITVFDYLYIFLINQECYYCEKETKVIACAISDFLYKDSFYEGNLYLIEELFFIPSNLEKHLKENFNYYKDEDSSGNKCFINHCQCDDLLENFYIIDNFDIDNLENKEETVLLYRIKLKNKIVIDGIVPPVPRNYLIKKINKIIDLDIAQPIPRHTINLAQYNINCDIYVGTACGENVLDSIKKATRSIKIISPYITPSFLEILREKSNNDVKVSILTSDNILKKIMDKDKGISQDDYQTSFPYIHSKIYIIDDVVYLGSLNFTLPGFNDQIEARMKITDEKAVAEFNDLFDKIYNEISFNLKIYFYNNGKKGV